MKHTTSVRAHARRTKGGMTPVRQHLRWAKNLKVYDNKGISFDRYSIIDMKTGDYVTMSDNPLHPQGFNQYGGVLPPEQRGRLNYVGEVEVKLDKLPTDVQKAIKERFAGRQ